MAMINPVRSTQQAASRNSNPASCLLPPSRYSRGFALLIAVIFMSVMLTLGLALGSLGYKQEILASAAIESQYAFYAADAAIECTSYADQQQNIFAYTNYPGYVLNGYPSMSCDVAQSAITTVSYDSTVWVSHTQLSLDNGTHCADVVIYKYSTPQDNVGTYLFAQGYDVPCTTVANPGGARYVSRGISTHY
jgi:Tfp pilus assembly protein PilX